ncbi:MAG: hypothetical protein UFX20_15010 [Longibaculum muris]|mgnify:FL=1|uniref:Sporulation factor SpoIIGA n=1 Tax=Longibaculum muris TaxID=1796628 RepID=A0A4R3Z2Q6_9FIRM|nr:hypothetical protein [Longibaculum muris]KXU51654.1 putative sigma-E processing peptidase SpoIIGA [Candidatus Stoquefichus sp. KLE1796]MBS5368190.1 hypothetical protein [Coprobacillus cateniformis]MCR1888459.1 hypothetical protein [Longibaculum muris]MED9813402.1 hypothetical protein [Longibaculum muris]TCV99329.1 hypothetical protein EDD60_11019 [Longibaculum muris]
MEVYLEVTYLINALMILLTFELLCYLLNIQMSQKELLKYVLTYNLSVLFLYIDFFDGFLLLYDLLLSIFYFKKLTYIYYPLYLFIYISLLSFLSWILPSAVIFQSVLIVEGIHFISLLIIGILCLLIFYFYISFCQHKIHSDEYVDVKIENHQCLGFIDNGNKVFYKGYPVIFISKEFLGEYQKIDRILIETANQKEWIDLIMIDDIEINHQLLHHVYVGVMSSHEYDCILNSQLLGGLL